MATSSPLSPAFLVAFLCMMICAGVFPEAVLATSKHEGVTRHYTFNIRLKNVTRLCHTKSMVTVNGKFPGPRVLAIEGDRLVVNVVNHVSNNISIHWHGVRQLQSGWADGPSYITQCPIQTGQSYVYNFSTVGQRGTLFWHAHFRWLRATVYGPLIILPSRHASYPFPKPHKEVTIMLGEWFNSDPEAIISQALQTGDGPNDSEAYTFNGLPDTYKLKVKPGKTYLLRLINAALNGDLFFSIANHTFTVVEADTSYVKPFETNLLVLAAGQTTTVLLKTKPSPPNAKFFMLARPYFIGMGTIDNTTAAGILEYDSSSKNLTILKPYLPPINAINVAANFSSKLRSLSNAKFPANVPQTVDKRFFFTLGLGTRPCPQNQTCQGPNGKKFAASVNNISFALPTTALLQSYFLAKSEGVYTADFPAFPPYPFNYTGPPPNNTFVAKGTKALVIPFNTRVEVVMQGTSILGSESHPLHLHGYNFYVVGQGFGNFDPKKDPEKFNLVDPVERYTVGVPSRGWVAIRFLADNPGLDCLVDTKSVWFMHCHLDIHLSWGLGMVWIVLDGELPNQKLPPPPSDLPKC